MSDPNVLVLLAGAGILLLIFCYPSKDHHSKDEPEPVQGRKATGGPSKSRRRWLQFRLRTLMILSLICAVGCALVARRLERKRREREAVAAIVNLGGRVWYTYQQYEGPGHPPWESKAEPFGPSVLRRLFGDDFFSEVDGIFLNSERNAVSDADLAYLKDLRQLRQLSLSFGGYTDAGLANLKGLTQLEKLGLDYSKKITDAGLENIKDLNHLSLLEVSHTDVSDAGIAKLKSLTHLRFLDLTQTKVTDSGVKELQRALPKCEIRH